MNDEAEDHRSLKMGNKPKEAPISEPAIWVFSAPSQSRYSTAASDILLFRPTQQIIRKLSLSLPTAVSLSSPSHAAFAKAFPEEKEEGGTFGEKTDLNTLKFIVFKKRWCTVVAFRAGLWMNSRLKATLTLQERENWNLNIFVWCLYVTGTECHSSHSLFHLNNNSPERRNNAVSTFSHDTMHVKNVFFSFKKKKITSFDFMALVLTTVTHTQLSTHFSSAYKDLTFSASEEVAKQWLRISQHASLLTALPLRFNLLTDSFSVGLRRFEVCQRGCCKRKSSTNPRRPTPPHPPPENKTPSTEDEQLASTFRTNWRTTHSICNFLLTETMWLYRWKTRRAPLTLPCVSLLPNAKRVSPGTVTKQI